LWNVLGGGGRESPVKHGARGASTGGGGQQGGANTGRGGAQVGKDRAGGGGGGAPGPAPPSTSALCTRFTLVLRKGVAHCYNMSLRFHSRTKVDTFIE
jgi:hypothetical protein